MAASRAQLMFGCYRKGDANDPDTYTAAVAAVLTRYPPEVVAQVTDPRTGLPSRSDFLPTVKEVHDACELIVEREARAVAREKMEREQVAETKRLNDFYRNQPKVDLKARHGPNWGMKCDPEKENEAAAERRRVLLADANRRVFEAECQAAGFPLDSPVSPSLARLLAQKGEAA